jgi:hypothetical protein
VKLNQAKFLMIAICAYSLLFAITHAASAANIFMRWLVF